MYNYLYTYVQNIKPDTRWKKILTDDSRIITREGRSNDEDDGEEKIVDKSKDDDDDDDDNDDDEEGHQKRCSNRVKK